MIPRDLLSLSWEALRAHRLRTRMTYAAIAIGVGSVLVLTSLGEGAREWIVGQMSSLGSNIIVTLPGRTETKGGPPIAPSSSRDLTLEDFEAVRRRLPGLQRAVPIVVGEATVTFESRGRAATVMGTTSEFLPLRQLAVDVGSNLPETDADQGSRVCVIGRTIRRELFGDANPLGARLQIGEVPFRVVGLLAERGMSQHVNLDDIVIVPVANALKMFNRSGLFRILVQLNASADLAAGMNRLTEILQERHDGEVDFTVLSPGAVAESLGGIIRIVTAALAGIAAISLAVAGIGVMNVMVVSVTERTPEIGLMKAIGASNAQVLSLFLAEAVMLSLIGGAFGVGGGWALVRLGRALYPKIPFQVPEWALALSVGVACAVGVAFGILPALRAARLEPLESLRRKV